MKRLRPWLPVFVVLLGLGLFTGWRADDFRMPPFWFDLVERQGDGSVAARLESFRYNLIKARWRAAAQRLDLIGQWRCDDGYDGSFLCEFTEDGVFHIKADDPNSTWAVWAKDLDGLPYHRDPSGFSIPAGRSGGRPNDTGVIYGQAFLLEEGPERYTSGYLSTIDGNTIEVTLDSSDFAIVYEQMVWERVP